MFCRNCGMQMNDDAMFCPACGTQTSNAQTKPQQEAYQPESYAQPEPVQNDYYAQQEIPQTEYAQPEGAYYQQDSSFYQQPEVKAKKSRKAPGKKGKLIIAVVAVVVVAALAFGFLAPGITNLATLLGMSSQMNEVFEAAKKTVFESESLTIEYVQSSAYERYDSETDSYKPYEYVRSIKCYAEIGDDINSTTALLELKTSNSNGEEYTSKAGMLDGEFYEEENGKYEEDASDLIEYYEDQLDRCYGIDIDLEDTINEVLNGKIDEKAVEDIFNTILRDALEDVMEEELGDSMELPEYKECMKMLRRFFVKGLSKDSITFKKSGDMYEYTVDISDVIDDFAEFAEKDKKTAGYVEEAADMADGDADDFYDSLKNAADEAKGAKLEGEVKVEGGRLTYFSIVQEDGDWSSSYEIIISDVNKTTVDEGEIKKMKNVTKAEEYYYY